jgi:hypothetical protein
MNLYKREDKRQYQASLKNIDGRVADQINRSIVNADRGDRDAINEIKRVLSENQTRINNSSLFGGRSKTMKKRQRKTRKPRSSPSRKFVKRGGYVYSSSRGLDKSSSIVSSGSGSKSKNNSRNSTRTRRTTRTTTSSPNSSTHTTSSPNF